MPRIPISQCFVVLRSAPPSARPRSTTTGRSGSRSQCLRIPASHESTTRDWVEGEAGAGRMGETAGPVGVLDALAAADTAWTPEWTPQRRPGGVLSACGVPRLGGWPPAPRSGRGRCRVSKSPEGVARSARSSCIVSREGGRERRETRGLPTHLERAWLSAGPIALMI